jgi:hypothetical protein
MERMKAFSFTPAIVSPGGNNVYLLKKILPNIPRKKSSIPGVKAEPPGVS